jgi:hypothetical protein
MLKIWLRLTQCLLFAFIFLSCSYDALEDRISALEKDIANMEDILGHNEPMTTTINTITLGNDPISYSIQYNLKELTYNYIYKDYDNPQQYYIVFSRVGINAYDEFSYAAISYNTTTNTAIPAFLELSFKQQNGQTYYTYIQPNNIDSFNATVSSFDDETGEVDVSFMIRTTDNSYLNIYGGKPMEVVSKFKGRLNIHTDAL